LGGETWEKKPLVGPNRRWKANIKRDLQQMRWGGMECSDWSQDSDSWSGLVNKEINHRVT
jgi:hypothetical protein